MINFKLCAGNPYVDLPIVVLDDLPGVMGGVLDSVSITVSPVISSTVLKSSVATQANIGSLFGKVGFFH